MATATGSIDVDALIACIAELCTGIYGGGDVRRWVGLGLVRGQSSGCFFLVGFLRYLGRTWLPRPIPPLQYLLPILLLPLPLPPPLLVLGSLSRPRPKGSILRPLGARLGAARTLQRGRVLVVEQPGFGHHLFQVPFHRAHLLMSWAFPAESMYLTLVLGLFAITAPPPRWVVRPPGDLVANRRSIHHSDGRLPFHPREGSCGVT